MELVSFPASDIIAAQADVRNLALSQLLHIRCGNLDFNATVPSMRAQSEFLTSIDETLEKRMAARLAAQPGVSIAPGQVSEVVRLVLLIYGVHEQIDKETASSSNWLVRCGQLEAVLSLPDCELRKLEALAEVSVYCHRSLSKASAAVPRVRKQLHWEVDLSTDPQAFESIVQPRRTRTSTGRPSAARAGLEDSPASREGAAPVDPEVVAKVRQRLAEAEASVDALRGELAAAKASAAESNSRCEEFSAAKTEAESGKAAAVKELEAALAELVPLREKFAAVKAAEAKASQELAAMKTKLSSAKDAEAKISLKASGLRQEVSFAKQAEEHWKAQATRLQEELAAAKKWNMELTAEVTKLRKEVEKASAVVAKSKEKADVIATSEEEGAEASAPVASGAPEAGAEPEAEGGSTASGGQASTEDMISKGECELAAPGVQPSEREDACVAEAVAAAGAEVAECGSPEACVTIDETPGEPANEKPVEEKDFPAKSRREEEAPVLAQEAEVKAQK
uniref:Uncharacterized protein n=1 Tax=Pyrodinium bahamense TaxID=73915 RepID=A0A7S0A4X8_9DINO